MKRPLPVAEMVVRDLKAEIDRLQAEATELAAIGAVLRHERDALKIELGEADADRLVKQAAIEILTEQNARIRGDYLELLKALDRAAKELNATLSHAKTPPQPEGHGGAAPS